MILIHGRRAWPVECQTSVVPLCIRGCATEVKRGCHQEDLMGNRSGSLMAMVALVAISVAMPVAQAPVAAQQQQQQYGRIAKYNAACTEVTNIRKKEHLTALPDNV